MSFSHTGFTSGAGQQGSQGVPGEDGNSVLNGTGAPSIAIGRNGDFYIDTVDENLYGPLGPSGWGSPTSLVGPPGSGGLANMTAGQLAIAFNATTINSSIAYASTATASTIVSRDAYGNTKSNIQLANISTTTASASTILLLHTSAQYQVLIGTGNEDYKLPNASTLIAGWIYYFINESTGVLTINTNDDATYATVASGGGMIIILASTGTSNGTWVYRYLAPSNAVLGTNSTKVSSDFLNVTNSSVTVGGTGLPDSYNAFKVPNSSGASQFSVDTIDSFVRLGSSTVISGSDMVVGLNTITEISPDPINSVLAKVEAFIIADDYPSYTSYAAIAPNIGGNGSMILNNMDLTIKSSSDGAFTLKDTSDNIVVVIDTNGDEQVNIQGPNAPAKFGVYKADGNRQFSIDTLASVINIDTDLIIGIANSATKVSVLANDASNCLNINTATKTTTIENLVVNNIISNQLIPSIYGDGFDGDVTLTNTATGLTRDMFYNNLTMVNSVIDGNGFRIFVRNILTMDATSRIGNVGESGNNGGAGGSSGTVGGGTGAPNETATLTNYLGGAGGASGTQNSNGQRPTAAEGYANGEFYAFHNLQYCYGRTISGAILNGGTSGYGLINIKGGGGGGVVYVAAYLNNFDPASTLDVRGGGGGGGSPSGGGGGGFIILITSNTSSLPTFLYTGGYGIAYNDGDDGGYKVISVGSATIPMTSSSFQTSSETTKSFQTSSETKLRNEATDLRVDASFQTKSETMSETKLVTSFQTLSETKNEKIKEDDWEDLAISSVRV